MNLEPMSKEKIANLTRNCFANDWRPMARVVELSMILAWVEAEARAREGDWGRLCDCPSRDELRSFIKKEIGWPDDYSPRQE